MLQLDTKAVRDPVHEGEICHDQGQFEDGAVGPTHLAQTRHFSFRARPGFEGEFHCEVEHRAFALGDRRLRIVPDNRIDKTVTASQAAETLRVMLDSIVALIGYGNDHGD